MKSGTTEKVKFKRLQRRLKLPLWQAIGLLESVWKFTSENAPDGSIGRFSDEEIAAYIEWEDDAESLVAALVETRWLDPDDVERLIVHDWSDHCANHLKGSFAKHGKTFADQRAKHRAKQSSWNGAKHGANDGAKHDAKHPYLTKPNQTTPTTPTGSCQAGGGGGEDFDSEWQRARPIANRIADAFGRRLSKGEREWVIKIAILACRHGQEWLEPAFEAMKTARNVNKPQGLMGKVLNEECQRRGSTLNRELASVSVAAAALQPMETTT